MDKDMKKIVKLVIEIIFLLGTLYALNLFVQSAEAINLYIPT